MGHKVLAGLAATLAFQSTHPQGVGRQPWNPSISGMLDFNPPTRKGWDPHALYQVKFNDFHFNPPTRKGWDVFLDNIAYHCDEFQSTHPQGVGRI